jgi:hypothetical protein
MEINFCESCNHYGWIPNGQCTPSGPEYWERCECNPEDYDD